MDDRVARCLLLAHVLSADGIMAAAEKAFLERAMTGLALDEAERMHADFEAAHHRQYGFTASDNIDVVLANGIP